MCTITWEERQHRLRLSGTCDEGDREAVEEALEAVGDPGSVLIVDLTAVASLAQPVAESIVTACDRTGGCRVSILRRHGSDVDRVLRSLGV
jgi:hypothetical protein